MVANPTKWTLETAQAERDEQKRRNSPGSFFYAQGRALVSAAGYFHDGRLTHASRGGVARKHRHRINLALFGQLMASFEYMLKDFVAQGIDLVDVLDDRLKGEKWLSLDIERVLNQRVAQVSVGALLVHPTMGWHDPDQVNDRFKSLYGNEPIATDEIRELRRLWVLRHTVAHNAGFLTGPDAGRLGLPHLKESVVAIDAEYLEETFGFLRPIATRVARDSGKALLMKWLRPLGPQGADWDRDEETYRSLKWLGTLVDSRPTPLPSLNETDYQADWQDLHGFV